MKIAIDISPLESGHKVRGVGFYVKHLKEALQKYYPEHSYTFFNYRSELSESFDVIHYPYFDPFQRTLPFRSGYKTVVTVHDLTPIVFPDLFPVGLRGKLNWEFQKRVVKRADAVITDSECSRHDVVRFTGISETKVTSVYLAAGDEFRKLEIGNWQMKIRQKYDLPEKFVLYVGDVTPNKNLPRLVKAAKKSDVPLVMVGKALAEKTYDKSHPWNKDLATIHDLAEGENNIYILGFVPTDDLVSIYNIATVFIMPSLYEGFGLPIVEAMQCGTPVITTREGSLKEVAGEGAYFVDVNSTDDMAIGIKKVYEDDHLRKKLSEKGQKQAQLFSWKKTAEDTLQVYERVLSY
jgi:glycosyltransferase involved in cell wall biosynthesis